MYLASIYMLKTGALYPRTVGEGEAHMAKGQGSIWILPLTFLFLKSFTLESFSEV